MPYSRLYDKYVSLVVVESFNLLRHIFQATIRFECLLKAINSSKPETTTIVTSGLGLWSNSFVTCKQHFNFYLNLFIKRVIIIFLIRCWSLPRKRYGWLENDMYVSGVFWCLVPYRLVSSPHVDWHQLFDSFIIYYGYFIPYKIPLYRI